MSVPRAPALIVAGLLAVAAGVTFGSCHADLVFNELSTCTKDPDCILPSMHCNAGACVACATDAHCTAPGFPRCDLTLHRCVACVAAADCGSGGLCRQGRCATPCTAGCPAAAPKCDDSICTQCDDGIGCAASPSGPICIDHACYACKDDTSCGGAEPRCDPVTHACVQCQTNTDCPAARPLCNVAVGACAAIP